MTGRLSAIERLRLHQLQLRLWMAERDTEAKGSEPGQQRPYLSDPNPRVWCLTGGIDLDRWQKDACESWFAGGTRGTLKIVTGAGKTVIALAIAERLQRDHDPDLRVAVVVPTIVLLNQWHETLLSRSNLPPEWIGRLGGGWTDEFGDGVRVLLGVLPSAQKSLPGLVKKAKIESHLLLVVDEAHRAGAPEMRRVLETPRTYSLGLSATPEREDDTSDDTPSDVEAAGPQVMDALGKIVYELSPAEAVRLGVLPPFEMLHYGLSLTKPEQDRYDKLSRSITETRDQLMDRSPSAARTGGGARLSAWCQREISKGGDLAGLAGRYVSETSGRKRLLYSAESRMRAPLVLLERAFLDNKETQAMLFHESIEEVENLYDRLVDAGLPVVMEHSKLPDPYRTQSIELFRKGLAKVIVSPRSLIEGFDVPSADMGIIVASSTSVRQRIQSIGRILRKPRDPGAKSKTGRIHVLYIRDTTDERIYEKIDLEELIGASRTLYYQWDPPETPIEQPGPPRRPLPPEEQIDWSALKPGSRYPGRYEGASYSCDHQGNIRDEAGRFVRNPQGIPARIKEIKGSFGSFKVTPRQRAVLVIMIAEEGWECFYAGQLRETFQFEEEEAGATAPRRPGDRFPGPLIPAQELQFRQALGGVISKKVRRGLVNARGVGVSTLVSALRDLERSHGRITRFYVNAEGDAFWRTEGTARFILKLEAPLEFGEEEAVQGD